MRREWHDLYSEEQLPLLYRAACDGAWGTRETWHEGAITSALFVYLEGRPEPQSAAALQSYAMRPLVCLSSAWEEYILAHAPTAARCQRALMTHQKSFNLSVSAPLPEGFELTDFNEKIFSLHPFSHGENYPAFDDFRKSGSGAAILHNGSVVASASSFLSHQGEVELDVSTDAAFRRKGLATACVRQMLLDCQSRGITVHWDAQNNESRRLAEKFGFNVQKNYPVYLLPPQA